MNGSAPSFTMNGTVEATDDTASIPNVLHHYPEILLHAAAFCCVIFVTIGVPGNLLTILALTRSKRVRNATAAFIVNLSVADLLFCTFNLPLAVSTFLHRGWVHGDTLCELFPFFRYGNVAVSLFSVLAITINRYVMIAHQRFYTSVYRRRYIAAMVFAIWSVSFGMLIPTLFGHWGRFGFDPSVGSCTIMPVNGRSPKTFLWAMAFVLPCVVITLCYVRIFWIVRQSQSKTRPSGAGGRRFSETMEGAPRRERKEGRDMRLVKMILVIFFSFIACYLPVTVVKVYSKEESLPVVNILGYLLIYLTACINPIIYVLMSTEYRRAYKSLFVCDAKDETSHSTYTHTSKV